MKCPNCGYEEVDLSISSKCPNCRTFLKENEKGKAVIKKVIRKEEIEVHEMPWNSVIIKKMERHRNERERRERDIKITCSACGSTFSSRLDLEECQSCGTSLKVS